MAPEVMKGPYGRGIDVFGFGMCLLFMLLSGCRQIIDEILATAVSMDYLDSLLKEKGIGLDGQNLLHKTLAVNPDHRISFEEALKEPFLSTAVSETNESPVATPARAGLGQVIQRTESLILHENDDNQKTDSEDAIRKKSKRPFEEVEEETTRSRSVADRKRLKSDVEDEAPGDRSRGEPATASKMD